MLYSLLFLYPDHQMLYLCHSKALILSFKDLSLLQASKSNFSQRGGGGRVSRPSTYHFSFKKKNKPKKFLKGVGDNFISGGGGTISKNSYDFSKILSYTTQTYKN